MSSLWTPGGNASCFRATARHLSVIVDNHTASVLAASDRDPAVSAQRSGIRRDLGYYPQSERSSHRLQRPIVARCFKPRPSGRHHGCHDQH